MSASPAKQYAHWLAKGWEADILSRNDFPLSDHARKSQSPIAIVRDMPLNDAETFLDDAVEAIRSGSHDRAQSACRQALSILPAADSRRPEALSLLGLALADSDSAASVQALRQAVEADGQEPNFRINLGRMLVRFGDVTEGIQQLESARQLSGNNVAAVQPLAEALMAKDRPQDAVGVLREALAQNPSEVLGRSLAKAYYACGDLYAADDAMRSVMSRTASPSQGDLLTTARLGLDLFEFERAEAAIEPLLEAIPTSPDVAATAVRLFVWQGKQQRALEILSQALAANPDNPHLLMLAVTHDEALSPATLTSAEQLEASLTDDAEAKTSLLYPLARFYDRKKEYERAWTSMSRANRLTRLRRSGGDRVEPDGISSLLRQRVDNSLTVAAAAAGNSGPASGHVYLVGAPRTGSSLLQSILTAHDGVMSVGERGALLSRLLDIADKRDTETFEAVREQLRSADIAGLARQGVNSDVVVDKTPHNIYVLPLIDAVHPGARFVNVLRDPRDVAISMLFHDFSELFVEATDISLIESMLRVRLFAAKKYLEAGIDMLSVHYEDFVNAPNVQGGHIARYLGIDWDESTLDPVRRNAAVPTFSAGQVRRPIESPGADRWARFAPFMGDANESLTSLADESTAT